MINIEKIKLIVSMFKADKISSYVFERELGEYFGDKISVILEKTNSNKSYGIFAVPEKLVEGLKITFVIDEYALKTIYNEEEFAYICERLLEKEQKLLSRYNNFYVDSRKRDVSLQYALGFLLSLYQDCFGIVTNDNTSFPEENDVMNYVDIFSSESATSEDIEGAKVKGVLSNKIIDFAKKYVKHGDEISVRFATTFEVEKPAFCLGQQEILKHATSTFGVRDHKEIPYDYLPKTNQ